MPLFKPRPDDPNPTPAAAPPARHAGGLFTRRNRSTSPPPSPSPSEESDYRSATSGAASVRSGFFFPRRRASVDSLRSRTTVDDAASVRSGATVGSRKFFGLALADLARSAPQNDPRVLIAREKVATAEAAEREADRALLHARARVRDALQHIKALELEAKEETQRAEAKQAETKLVSKDARRLGRHE
ncbi:hypothetical protein B0H17DRAFT_1125195 [Mycena rosella]|uniref:Uncharacterized protein n=1 Tax=Mycena rosella TaxID=1033263 RepID=A0AAD7GXB3_MYCRO|nr:hypothetical protein B0H17DRAFT_1125195 [Mycena rosella]